jgi:hypothetical protein
MLMHQEGPLWAQIVVLLVVVAVVVLAVVKDSRQP